MKAPPILGTREALVVFMKANTEIGLVLDPARIYGERSDPDGAWPFSRMGEFEGAREVINGNVHVFSKSIVTDEVDGIVEVIATQLDGTVLELETDSRRVNIEVTRTRRLADPEERSAWHGIIAIQATIAKDCDDR